MFRKYRNVDAGEEPWKKYGRLNDWNIDLVPKLLMYNGELTNILVSTDVTRYLEFKNIGGSYVQQGEGSKARIYRLPTTDAEALGSSLLGVKEKFYSRKFFSWIATVDENDPSTHLGLFLRLLLVGSLLTLV